MASTDLNLNKNLLLNRVGEVAEKIKLEKKLPNGEFWVFQYLIKKYFEIYYSFYNLLSFLDYFDANLLANQNVNLLLADRRPVNMRSQKCERLEAIFFSCDQIEFSDSILNICEIQIQVLIHRISYYATP